MLKYGCAECAKMHDRQTFIETHDERKFGEVCPFCSSEYVFEYNHFIEDEVKRLKKRYIFTIVMIVVLAFLAILFITKATSEAQKIPGLLDENLYDIERGQSGPVDDTSSSNKEAIKSIRHKDGYWCWAKVTAYEPSAQSCGADADGFTSTMVNVKSYNANNIYGIAADPKRIAYGTKVYVPEYWKKLQQNNNTKPSKMSIIDDTGGGMRQFRPYWRKGKYIKFHFDVRFRRKSTCKEWGIKYLKVFIFD